jgi:Mrp family chromosome partitioning ATPase
MPDVKTLNIFRQLRTKLMQKAKNSNFSLLVSSIAPEGGSTYISENLAASIALDFEKTALLVSCSNSLSKHDKLVCPSTDYGLTDYIDDTSLTASDIIYASGIPRFRKVPIGSYGTSSSELFVSERMSEFMKEIKSRYNERHIILDAPPINSSSDARVLADHCDFTVLVVPYGKVTNLQITAGINSIPTNKFAGLVFNN